MAATLEIKVLPNASCSEVAGWTDNVVKIRIQAPALEGRANDELREFLADELGVHRRDVTLVRGDKSRQKVVRIENLTPEQVRQRLGGA